MHTPRDYTIQFGRFQVEHFNNNKKISFACTQFRIKQVKITLVFATRRQHAVTIHKICIQEKRVYYKLQFKDGKKKKNVRKMEKNMKRKNLFNISFWCGSFLPRMREQFCLVLVISRHTHTPIGFQYICFIEWTLFVSFFIQLFSFTSIRSQ